ncbi:MAG: hypothetical protein V4724_13820 [Pseudomonadota bacterium]
MNARRASFRLGRIWLCALLACACAGAAGLDPAPASYTVGVEQLQYNGAPNKYDDYGRAVLDAFAQRQGYVFRYVPLPVNRLFAAFARDRTLDFKYPDNPDWQKALRGSRQFSYSTPVVSWVAGTMVLPQHKGRPLAQVRTLGAILGFTPLPYLQMIERKEVNLVTSNGYASMLNHALAGHLDAVYVNLDLANDVLRDELKAPGGLLFDPGLPYLRSEVSLSTLRHPDIIARFNLFLQNERPLLARLRAQYRIDDAGPIPADQ